MSRLTLDELKAVLQKYEPTLLDGNRVWEVYLTEDEVVRRVSELWHALSNAIERIERLREYYIQHKSSCEIWLQPEPDWEEDICTCGLSTILAQTETEEKDEPTE